MEEYHAKIAMDLILEFKRLQELMDRDIEETIKLSEYNLQQFWCYIQRKIITKI